MAKNKPTKSRVIEVPNSFNLQLKKRVLELEEIGVKLTIPELIVKYAQIGFKSESESL